MKTKTKMNEDSISRERVLDALSKSEMFTNLLYDKLEKIDSKYWEPKIPEGSSYEDTMKSKDKANHIHSMIDALKSPIDDFRYYLKSTKNYFFSWPKWENKNPYYHDYEDWNTLLGYLLKSEAKVSEIKGEIAEFPLNDFRDLNSKLENVLKINFESSINYLVNKSLDEEGEPIPEKDLEKVGYIRNLVNVLHKYKNIKASYQTPKETFF